MDKLERITDVGAAVAVWAWSAVAVEVMLFIC